MRPVIAYDIVRISLAGVLLLAAGLKGYQLATKPVLGTGLLDSHWFLIAVVEFELLFGMWLLAGRYPKWTWAAALSCFGLFAGVSLWKAFSGKDTCGCFGQVPVNPWYTFVLDLGVLVALLCSRPAWDRSPVPAGAARSRFRVAGIAGVLLFAGVSAAVAMGSYQSASLTDSGEIIFGDSEFVVLEPEAWIGKRFPLLRHVEIDVDLASGSWIVVLYRTGCSSCDEFAAGLGRSYSPARSPGLPRRFAFVEVSPCSSQMQYPVLLSAECRVGRLSNQYRWILPAPVVAVLEDGAVVRVPKGSDVDELCRSLMTYGGA